MINCMSKEFVTLQRLVAEFKKCPEYNNTSTEWIKEIIRKRCGKFPGKYCKFRFSSAGELYIKLEELRK